MLLVTLLSCDTKNISELVSDLDNTVLNFSTDWNQYTILNLDNLTKKPLQEVGNIALNLSNDDPDYLTPKYYHEKVGRFLVWYNNTTAKLSCIDLENKKYLWGIRGYLNNEYGQGQGHPDDKTLICTTASHRIKEKVNCVVSLDLFSSKENWRFQLPEWNQKDKQFLPYIQKVTSTYVFVKSIDSLNHREMLIALDSKTGQEIWQYKNPIMENSFYYFSHNNIVFTGIDGNICCIRQDDGKQSWLCKTIKQDDPYYFYELPENQILALPYFCENVTKNSFYMIDGETGRIKKQGIEFLALNQNSSLLIEAYNEKEHWLIASIKTKETFYFSKIDLSQMKEMWRIPFCNYYSEEIFDCTHEVFLDPTLPDRLYIQWGKKLLRKDADQIDTIEETILSDGFYEINAISGKLLWKTNMRCNLSDGLLYFFSYPSDKVLPVMGVMKMKTHSILWASRLKGSFLENGELKPFTEESCSLLKHYNDDTDTRDGYIEMSIESGDILAYYPNNWQDDKLDFVYYLHPYRIFQNNQAILLMVPKG